MIGLIEEAQKLGGHRTKEEAVIAALDQYIKDPELDRSSWQRECVRWS